MFLNPEYKLFYNIYYYEINPAYMKNDIKQIEADAFMSLK
jgi:hypothetical protein